MTIKSKRARALREMDGAEASRYVLGGLVDETFHADKVHAALQGANVDLAAFDAFFGQRLGLFRDVSDYLGTKPAVAKESELIEEAMQHIQQIRLRLECLPPEAEMYVATICLQRHGEGFEVRRRRLDAELNEMVTLLGLTLRKLDSLKGATGRKSEAPRDRLLHDVAHWLAGHGTRSTSAAGAAADVLRAVGIAAPNDPKKARAIVRAVEAKNSR